MALALLCSCSTLCIAFIALVSYAVALQCQADACIIRLHQDTALAEISLQCMSNVLSILQTFEASHTFSCCCMLSLVTPDCQVHIYACQHYSLWLHSLSRSICMHAYIVLEAAQQLQQRTLLAEIGFRIWCRFAQGGDLEAWLVNIRETAKIDFPSRAHVCIPYTAPQPPPSPRGGPRSGGPSRFAPPPPPPRPM